MDDVARLSSAMLKPRPGLSEGSVKSLWLAEVRRVFPACFPYLLFRSSADRHNRQELCAGAAEELQIGAADRSSMQELQTAGPSAVIVARDFGACLLARGEGGELCWGRETRGRQCALSVINGERDYSGFASSLTHASWWICMVAGGGGGGAGAGLSALRERQVRAYVAIASLSACRPVSLCGLRSPAVCVYQAGSRDVSGFLSVWLCGCLFRSFFPCVSEGYVCPVCSAARCGRC